MIAQFRSTALYDRNTGFASVHARINQHPTHGLISATSTNGRYFAHLPSDYTSSVRKHTIVRRIADDIPRHSTITHCVVLSAGVYETKVSHPMLKTPMENALFYANLTVVS